MSTEYFQGPLEELLSASGQNTEAKSVGSSTVVDTGLTKDLLEDDTLLTNAPFRAHLSEINKIINETHKETLPYTSRVNKKDKLRKDFLDKLSEKTSLSMKIPTQKLINMINEFLESKKRGLKIFDRHIVFKIWNLSDFKGLTDEALFCRIMSQILLHEIPVHSYQFPRSELVNFALLNGADINQAFLIPESSSGRTKTTPLIKAINRRSIELVAQLLEKNRTDINALIQINENEVDEKGKNFSFNPLSRALEDLISSGEKDELSGSIRIFLYLLQHGARTDIVVSYQSVDFLSSHPRGQKLVTLFDIVESIFGGKNRALSILLLLTVGVRTSPGNCENSGNSTNQLFKLILLLTARIQIKRTPSNATLLNAWTDFQRQSSNLPSSSSSSSSSCQELTVLSPVSLVERAKVFLDFLVTHKVKCESFIEKAKELDFNTAIIDPQSFQISIPEEAMRLMQEGPKSCLKVIDADTAAKMSVELDNALDRLNELLTIDSAPTMESLLSTDENAPILYAPYIIQNEIPLPTVVPQDNLPGTSCQTTDIVVSIGKEEFRDLGSLKRYLSTHYAKAGIGFFSKKMPEGIRHIAQDATSLQQSKDFATEASSKRSFFRYKEIQQVYDDLAGNNIKSLRKS